MTMKKKSYVYILILAMLVAGIALYMKNNVSSGPVTITKQPESVTVSYPEGASFSVKVDHPKAVASYQWMIEDIAGNVFELAGYSAKTDTVIVPSTQQTSNPLEFYCIITDKDGNETVSERAILDTDNREVNKPVFYVCEYAIEPGQSLDLSKVDIGGGKKLGSGTVSFDSNATDIVITDLDLDNSQVVCDFSIAANVGLSLVYDHSDQLEYNVTLNGNNRIMNDYYDFDYNVGGIPFDFYFTGLEEERPLVNLIGDGSLTIINGTNAIRVIGDLMVDVDVNIEQTKELYSDGICAEHLMIAEGSKLDLRVFGSALYAKGNLYIKGADLKIDANAPHISMGIATKNVLQAGNDMRIEDSTIDIQAHVDHEVCDRVAGYTAFSAAYELKVYNSELTYTIDTVPTEEVYASNFVGLSAGLAEFEDSKLSLTIDSEDIFNAFGIYTDEYILFTNSEANVDVHCSGPVYGIAPEGDFSADDSVVNVNVTSYDKYGTYDTYGIMCEELVIRCVSPESKVRSFAENGMAIGCNLNDIHDDPAKYKAGYQAVNVYLRDGSICMLPKESIISLGSVIVGDLEPYYIYVETYYDANDLNKPASEVLFGAGE